MDEYYSRYLASIKGQTLDPIPQLVHQVWLLKDKYTNIPSKEYVLHQLLQKNLPLDYVYKFWQNKDIDELWNSVELKKYKECFDKAQPHIVKCDMSRYAIMYMYGGVYIDMDAKLTDKELITNRDRNQTYYYEDDMTKVNKVFNGFLVSKPRNPFWLLVLDIICNKLSQYDNYTVNNIQDVYSVSGPVLLSKVILRLTELLPEDKSLIPLPHEEFPIKLDQTTMSRWKSDLVKSQVNNTGYNWLYVTILLIPILILLIFIMWCWTQNSLRGDIWSVKYV